MAWLKYLERRKNERMNMNIVVCFGCDTCECEQGILCHLYWFREVKNVRYVLNFSLTPHVATHENCDICQKTVEIERVVEFTGGDQDVKLACGHSFRTDGKRRLYYNEHILHRETEAAINKWQYWQRQEKKEMVSRELKDVIDEFSELIYKELKSNRKTEFLKNFDEIIEIAKENAIKQIIEESKVR
ncbi:MAG: hypothetical protein QXG39_06375 [Candidatus Aenigmatarchaeota archaeon]